MRIDSYESKEHQQYVRTFLDGRFENSAFCLLAPNGQDWLTRAGRGPEMVLGHRSSVVQLRTIAARYPDRMDGRQAIVPDFHSVRQALNVASADQRVLVLIAGPTDETQPLRNSLRAVASDPQILGRFHFDFDASSDWHSLVTGLKNPSGIILIRPGTFGMDGSVMTRLPLDTANQEIVDALKAVNVEFARTTKKKVYSSHVTEGFRRGIYFESAVPFGEDRDGDGQIDQRSSRPGSLQGRDRPRSR